MSLKTHLANHWHHYSIGTILIGIVSRIDLVWEKTEWIRAMVGWVEKKKKTQRRKR